MKTEQEIRDLMTHAADAARELSLDQINHDTDFDAECAWVSAHTLGTLAAAMAWVLDEELPPEFGDAVDFVAGEAKDGD